MNKRTKRLIGIAGLAVGALGAAGAVLIKKRGLRGLKRRARSKSADVWARPGMMVTFRAELMPSRDSSERVYRVAELLPSGRVTLEGVAGEHNEKEFEPVRAT
jgi:hypothetical protein